MRSNHAVQHEKLVKPTVKICSKKIKKKRKSHPKWHDKSCANAHRDVVLTSKLLKGDPKNPYLKGKLISETKIVTLGNQSISQRKAFGLIAV